MIMSTAAIERKLCQFIDTALMRGQGVDLTPSTPLLEYGILDSFAIFRIVSFVEEEFEIALPLELLNADDFATVSTITRFVEMKLAEA